MGRPAANQHIHGIFNFLLLLFLSTLNPLFEILHASLFFFLILLLRQHDMLPIVVSNSNEKGDTRENRFVHR